MDIVKNLNRQKADIRKVGSLELLYPTVDCAPSVPKILDDVRVLQKDINMVSETSKRSFAVADETIFRVSPNRMWP